MSKYSWRAIFIWSLSLSFALSASGASAQASLDNLKKDLAACAANEGTLDRLECFDALTATYDLDAPQVVPSDVDDIGKWRIRQSINPIDDSETVVISLDADSGTSRWGDRIYFIARCQSNKTEAYIAWGDYLGDDSNDVYTEWKNVTIRLGDQAAKRQRWGISTDSKATFAPNWAGSLLKEIAQVDKMIAQTTPYSENPVTAIFDTRGFDNAVVPLAETCGWDVGTQ